MHLCTYTLQSSTDHSLPYLVGTGLDYASHQRLRVVVAAAMTDRFLYQGTRPLRLSTIQGQFVDPMHASVLWFYPETSPDELEKLAPTAEGRT